MQKNNYNYGLSILKMFMCFEVVLCHFWQYDNSLILKLFALMRNVAVPVFIMISFFLMKNFFLSLNHQKLQKRLVKLFKPQLYWAIIYFIIYKICIIIIPNISLKLSLNDLLWQIILGHSPNLNPSMWFQFDLIILTIIFSIICHHFNSKKVICLISLLLGALILQYSGLNYATFNSMIYELKYPLGVGINFEIDVTNIDEIYNRLKKNNYKIFAEIEDHWYRKEDVLMGCREFLVQDPNGFLLRFSQDIESKEINE